MANLNKVMLMGNLTRDPELSYLPSQTAVCELGLATNRRWTGQDGQAKEEVTFVDCRRLRQDRRNLAKYLKKGRPVFIEGRLQLPPVGSPGRHQTQQAQRRHRKLPVHQLAPARPPRIR